MFCTCQSPSQSKYVYVGTGIAVTLEKRSNQIDVSNSTLGNIIVSNFVNKSKTV